MSGRRLAILAVLGTVAVSAQDGSREWKLNVGGAGGGYISYSSPALSPDGNTIYIGVIRGSGGGRIIAVTRDGSVRWSRDRTAFVDSTPAVAADGTVYVGCGDGQFYALNPADGSVRWAYPVRSFVTSSPAIGADGTIYFGAEDGHLYALTAGGALRWTFRTGGIVDSSPAIGADGTIYVGSDDRNLYAIAPDGGERWRFSTGGRIFSSPAIGPDGTIYVGSADQRLYAIAPNGQRRWDYFTNGDIQSSPALGADGTIYFAADASFYALRPNDGPRLRWRANWNSASASTAAVRADGAVVVGADDGVVRALDPENGSMRWSFNTEPGAGDYIESSPTIASDGSIYIGSLDGHLYKLRGNGSPLSTVSNWPSFRRDLRRTGIVPARNPGAQLANIATRAQAGGDNNLVAGFVIEGVTQRAYMIRAVGPGLARLGIAGQLPDPRLDLFTLPARTVLQSNDNWRDSDEFTNASIVDTVAGVGAFPLEPGSRDAVILPALSPGAYTADVGSVDGQAGVALVEVYDARGGDPTGRIINLSTRGYVGTGQDVLIAGVVVGGVGNLRLLVRGIGPGLAQFGVSGVLTRPRLELFRGPTSLAVNTGWTTAGNAGDLSGAAASVAAFPLAAGSADAALVFDAQPGEYTVQISGVGGTTGEAMVEVYVLR